MADRLPPDEPELDVLLIVRKGGHEWRFPMRADATHDERMLLIEESKRTLDAAGFTAADFLRIGIAMFRAEEEFVPGETLGTIVELDKEAPRG